MLQFITSQSERYTLLQEVEMVIRGGCRWIELRFEHLPSEHRHEAMKKAAQEINSICKEADAFLIINGDVDLAIETECHGVHLNRGDMSPIAAREKMGAGAVIGVTVDNADEIIALKNKDIDYVSLDTDDLAKITDIVSAVRQAGVKMPIVAAKHVSLDNLSALLATGINGVAVSEAIINADDPEQYTRRLLSECR